LLFLFFRPAGGLLTSCTTTLHFLQISQSRKFGINFVENNFFYQLSFQSASGTGLAFILFTEAVNQFPGGNFWAILFFMMLFTLGLDSQFGTLQGVIQCMIDLKVMPNIKKEYLTGMKFMKICIVKLEMR
jgi:SNF family Na+-dependent transporter